MIKCDNCKRPATGLIVASGSSIGYNRPVCNWCRGRMTIPAADRYLPLKYLDDLVRYHRRSRIVPLPEDLM